MDDNKTKIPEQGEDNEQNEKLIADILGAKDKAIKERRLEAVEETQTDTEKVTVEKKPKKKKQRKKRSYGKFVFGLILTTVIISIAIFAAYFIITIGKDALGIDKPSTEVTMTIEKGTTAEGIAKILEDKNVIEYPLVFRLISKLQKADDYKAGDHVVRPDMAYTSIISTLQTDPIQDKKSISVTFPEGYTLYDSAKVLEEKGICNSEEFIFEFNSAAFGFDFESLVSTDNKFYKMEGYCFPDTYTFFEESSPKLVAKKIYENFSVKVNRNVLGRMKEMELTLDQMLALASIIQQEAPTKDEMTRVSSVFWNRMADKETYPKLQSDTTTKYVNEVIIPHIELPNEEMNIAYDTYKGLGLPPGAICNPGIDAIEAALYPADTEYTFFCSNLETKEFFYAKTDAQHEKNLVKAGLK